jgi:hypothetical protein
MYGIYDAGRVIGTFMAPMTVRSNRPVFVSDTLSLKRRVRERPAQRWELETALVPVSHDGQDLLVTLVTKGVSKTQQVLFPQNVGVIRARMLSSTVHFATGTIRSTQVSVSSHNGYIPKGTFLRFSNHSKIYMATSNLTNNGTLNIFPELRVAVGGHEMYSGDNVLGQFYFDTDNVQGMVYTDGILMEMGTVRMVEAI